jgi:hypothetical protein
MHCVASIMPIYVGQQLAVRCAGGCRSVSRTRSLMRRRSMSGSQLLLRATSSAWPVGTLWLAVQLAPPRPCTSPLELLVAAARNAL